MKLLRHYFISNNLDELDLFGKQLEKETISPTQIHVLSNDVEGILLRPHLYGVGSFMKLAIVRSGLIGATVGTCVFLIVVTLTYYFDWYKTGAGWAPFIFLALILFWFCVWEGGFIGIQRKNALFGKFKKALQDGLHVFYLDLYPNQEVALHQILKLHPKVILAGTGKADPTWLVVLNNKIGML